MKQMCWPCYNKFMKRIFLNAAISTAHYFGTSCLGRYTRGRKGDTTALSASPFQAYKMLLTCLSGGIVVPSSNVRKFH